MSCKKNNQLDRLSSNVPDETLQMLEVSALL